MKLVLFQLSSREEFINSIIVSDNCFGVLWCVVCIIVSRFSFNVSFSWMKLSKSEFCSCAIWIILIIALRISTITLPFANGMKSIIAWKSPFLRISETSNGWNVKTLLITLNASDETLNSNRELLTAIPIIASNKSVCCNINALTESYLLAWERKARILKILIDWGDDKIWIILAVNWISSDESNDKIFSSSSHFKNEMKQKMRK